MYKCKEFSYLEEKLMDSNTLIIITSSISSVVIGGIAICITYYFSKQTRELENDKVMRELFKEFNARFEIATRA